jgi:chromosomal replication initiator protein
MNVDEIFRQALLNRIGERRFSYWFAGARFSASPSGLIVRVENEFLCAFIRSSFQHELQKICVDVAGVELPIEICCDETPAPAFPTQNQPQTPAFETSAPAFPARSSSLPAIATGFSVQNGTSPQPAKKRGRPRKNPLPQDAERSVETPSPFFERAPEPNASVNFAFDADVFQASTPRPEPTTPAVPVSPIPQNFATYLNGAPSQNFLGSLVPATVPTSPLSAASPSNLPAPKRGRGRPRKNPLPLQSDAFAAPSSPTQALVPTTPDAWNLSESERAAWATDDAQVPQTRGRKPKTATFPNAAETRDDEVLRDANGFNIVKVAKQQTRTAVASSVRLASLDTFVEGFSNQLARKIADVAILQPGAMNPIFIGGPTSVGKTHLLEGICERYGRYPNRKPALYMTAEQFTTAFIQSLHGGVGSFRERFRNISLLALDDLHFLEGKTTTQVELLSVVDMLRQRNVQLVFSANRPLAELTKLSGELTTRVQGGFVCQIGPPEREMLSQILRQMALERRIELSDEVCRFVVSRFTTHARQLSGALNRLYVAHLTTGAPIDVPFAQEALADLIASNIRAVKLEDVERVVQETFGLDDEELKSKSRSKRCADPRALAMWLARKHTRSALAEIGAYFGGRRHSAVLSAQKKVDRLLKTNGSIENGSAAFDVADAIERMERALARSRS